MLTVFFFYSPKECKSCKATVEAAYGKALRACDLSTWEVEFKGIVGNTVSTVSSRLAWTIGEF